MDEFLKSIGALNDETRVRLLKFIYLNKEVCVCNIEASFDMVQSRISRHLKILKDGKYLDSKRVGKWVYYSIKKDLKGFQKSILEEIISLNIDIPKLIKGCKNG